MTRGATMQNRLACLIAGIVLFACADKNGQQPVSPSTTKLSQSTSVDSTESEEKLAEENDTQSDKQDSLKAGPRTAWVCDRGVRPSCHEHIASNKDDDEWIKAHCECQKVTERVIGTPSEEALKSHEGGGDYPDKNKFDRIESTEFSSLIDFFALCHKGNVNCQEYYVDGVLGVIPSSGGNTHFMLGDYTDYQRPYNSEHKDWKRQPMIVLNTPNNVITNTTAGDLIARNRGNDDSDGKPNRTNYKIRFRKILWKYDNILWDIFPYSNKEAPVMTTIVKGKHSLLANADQIEVFYDPDNLLKPAMRIYPEELAAEEDAKGIVWNDDMIKKSGLKSVRLIDANAAILADMEKNPYMDKPAP
jgi:hypothetical protein